MGSLTCVVKDNEFKIAHFCSNGDILKVMGVDLLCLIQEELQGNNLKYFTENLEKVRFAKKIEIKCAKFACDIGVKNIGVKINNWKAFTDVFPNLDRISGVEVIYNVLKIYEPSLVLNELDLARDYTSCKICYLIDIDNRVFEFYGQSDKEISKGERFYFLKKKFPKSSPVRLVKRIEFDELKLMDVDCFVNSLADQDWAKTVQ